MRNTKLVLAGAVGLTVALMATNASAGIVCNAEGDCWHTKTVYEYNPEWRLTVHPDDWAWKEGNYRWREHEGEGRGYWRRGEWVEF